MLETCLVDADVETVLLACSEDGLLTPMVSARLNQLLVFMSDSVIGFPNQVAFCPWLKLDESSTRLPGPPSLETSPSLLWQARSTRISIIQIRLQKGHDVFLDRRQSDKGSDLPLLFCNEKFQVTWLPKANQFQVESELKESEIQGKGGTKNL